MKAQSKVEVIWNALRTLKSATAPELATHLNMQLSSVAPALTQMHQRRAVERVTAMDGKHPKPLFVYQVRQGYETYREAAGLDKPAKKRKVKKVKALPKAAAPLVKSKPGRPQGRTERRMVNLRATDYHAIVDLASKTSEKLGIPVSATSMISLLVRNYSAAGTL